MGQSGRVVVRGVVSVLVIAVALAVTISVAVIVRETRPQMVSIWGQDADTTQTGDIQRENLVYTHLDPATKASGVYLASADGRIVDQLVVGQDEVYRDVAWSSDGKSLYLTAGSDATRQSLWRMQSDGSDRTMLIDGSRGSIESVIPSPEGQTLAFGRQRADGSFTVWTSRTDGTDAREIGAISSRQVEPSFSCSGLSPASSTPEGWSPDGIELLVKIRSYGCEVEFSEVVTVNVATRQVATVVARDASHPRWSPAGTDIAYDGLAITDRAGLNRRSVGIGYAPAWSPAGDLAFVRATDWADVTSYGLWVAPDADSSRARLVTNPVDVRADAPRWSPDGSRIAFLGLHDRGSTLWTVDAHGGELTRVGGPENGYVIDFDYPEGH